MSLIWNRRPSGSALLLVIISVFSVTPILVYSFGLLHSLSAKRFSKEMRQVIASQAARSSFVLMEAALARRLWEVPPDAQCLRMMNFSLSGTTDEGAQYTTDASYDATTRVISLTATATFKSQTYRFGKRIKALDVSDFLTFSKSTEVSEISRFGIAGQSATGVIAKDRKVYFEGPVWLNNAVRAPDVAEPTGGTWTSPRTTNLLGEYGMIFQGDRLYFLGGLQYMPFPHAQPFGSWPTYPSLSAELGATIGSIPANRFAQKTRGATLFFKDYTTANLLYKNVISGAPIDPALPPIGVLKKQVYPNALFCQTIPAGGPLNPQTATDTGCYIGDTDKWKTWSYQMPAGMGGISGEFSCLFDNSEPEATRKYCSQNKHFPKGFAQWRTDAGLDKILIGSEGEKVDYSSIGWDNLEALKEDAVACGAIVENKFPSTYLDCNLVDKRVMDKYKSGLNPCETIHKVDTEQLGTVLNNFNSAAYTNPDNANRYLRRVIYSGSPAEVHQADQRGLWTVQNNTTIRANLNLWFVNEERWIFKPNQSDLTSPINFPGPGDAPHNKAYFNQDVDPNPATAMRALNLVILSPDPIQINSPFHKEVSFADMQNMVPVVGGEFKPRRDIVTDYDHQENDSYTYGIRDVYLNNIGLISNANTGEDTGVVLRGLWSVDNWDNVRWIQNMCRMDRPDDGLATTSAGSLTSLEEITTSTPFLPHAFPSLPFDYSEKFIPPFASRFYVQTGGIPKIKQYIPYAFVKNGDYDPRVFFKGSKITASFESFTPTGKKSLTVDRMKPQDVHKCNWGNRSFIWPASSTGYNPTPPGGAACMDGAITTPDGTPENRISQFYVNRQGNPLFIQLPPEDDFRNLGTIFSVNLPTVQER